MLEAGGVRDDIEIVRTRERKAGYEGRHDKRKGRGLAGAGERKEMRSEEKEMEMIWLCVWNGEPSPL